MAVQTSSRYRGRSRKLSAEQTAALAERTRYRVIGIIIILLGVLGFFFFANGVDQAATSKFGLNIGSNAIRLPDLIVPTFLMVVFVSLVSLALGGYQLLRGFGKRSSLVLGIAILLFLFSFLTWATRDSSINLAGMLRATLLAATPIALGALAGILSERAGVVNIAIEGMMLAAALAGTIAASATHNLWIGVAAGVGVGLALGGIHAILSIYYRVDQVISGMVINIFSAGLTSFIAAKFLEQFHELNQPGTFSNAPIPLLSSLPFIGGIVFDNNIFVYAMFALLFIVNTALFFTRWGLRTRIVGEHPQAADTLGINVYRMRYIAVLLSGALAGFAGVYFTLGSVGRFDRLMTSGRGFIALAAVIFGNWTPFGAFGSSLIFGFADSLQGKLAILNVPIPSEFLLMAPYIATMIALTGLVGRTTPPAADGQPYEKQ